MCLSIKVKGLQDTVTFAMGAIREHKDVCALDTRLPSHQPQSPGQCLMAQDRNYTTIMAGHHEDGGKQWHQKSNQPHVVSCCKKPSNLWVKKVFFFKWPLLSVSLSVVLITIFIIIIIIILLIKSQLLLLPYYFMGKKTTTFVLHCSWLVM